MGEGQGFNRFLPQIIKGCLKNEEFPTSEGNQIRDFCYVSDIIDGIIATIKSEQVNGHILNYFLILVIPRKTSLKCAPCTQGTF